MKQNKMAKFIALFALFGIIIGIVGTGLLIIFSDNSGYEEAQISPEELQELINAYSGSMESGSGEVEISPETGTGESQ